MPCYTFYISIISRLFPNHAQIYFKIVIRQTLRATLQCSAVRIELIGKCAENTSRYGSSPVSNVARSWEIIPAQPVFSDISWCVTKSKEEMTRLFKSKNGCGTRSSGFVVLYCWKDGFTVKKIGFSYGIEGAFDKRGALLGWETNNRVSTRWCACILLVSQPEVWPLLFK